METLILKVKENNFKPEEIQAAADILRNGGLVAFPTETVYGLGAVYHNETALRKVFEVKGRPGDNPLILHIWHKKQLEDIVDELNPKYIKLMERFWPGPLTLIFPKKSEISPVITAGLPTVAVRMPSHPVARELLRLTNFPVAAPSANLSGRPSPTRGKHVIDDLDGKIPLIIDAGNCEAGIESTVLLLTDKTPLILRPGSVTKEMLEEVLHEEVDHVSLGDVERPQAPGMKYRHYAPKAPVTLVEGEEQDIIQAINRLTVERNAAEKVVIICFSEHLRQYRSGWVLDLGPRTRPEVAASRLYELLRYCDQIGADCIYVEGLDKTGIGVAVENRLYKAAGGNVIYVS